MFALVESGSITQMPRGNKGIQIGDVKYPAAIYTLWSEAERNAIGIYTVEIDNTNKKDEEWYINTNQTYTFSGGKVKGTYGSATAKAIADSTWTSQDKTDGLIPNGEDVGDLKQEGLKTIKKRIVKQQAAGILADTDWYITRKADAGTAVPSAVTTHRAAVRTKSGEMETAINNAADVDALAALYVYNDANPPVRPLGELPRLES